MFTFSQACLWFSTSCPIGSVSQPLKKKRKNIDLNSCQTKKQQRMMTMPTEWVNHLYKQPNTISKNHSWKKNLFERLKRHIFFIHCMFSLQLKASTLSFVLKVGRYWESSLILHVFQSLRRYFIMLYSAVNERHIAYPREWKISARASTLMRFRLKTHTFRCVEPGPPTLKRWSFSSKAHRFEYVHESGSKQKRVYISHKWRRSKTHQNENDDLKNRRRVCSTYVTTRNYRFWTL